MRISDWSSDVCSSDLEGQEVLQLRPVEPGGNEAAGDAGDQALQQNAAGARIEIGIGRTGRDDKAGEREDRQSQRRKHARHLKRMESRGWPRSASVEIGRAHV